MVWPNTWKIRIWRQDIKSRTRWYTSNTNLPWFTNSGGLRAMVEVFWESIVWFVVLIDEILLWDWNALLSISIVLELQISSETQDFLTGRPWIFSPFDGSSTAIIRLGLVKHPRQPLLCFESGLTQTMINITNQLKNSGAIYYQEKAIYN